MSTVFWISGISATIFSLMLLLFTLRIRQRYIKELPSRLLQAADGIADKLNSVKTGSIENIPTIAAAFGELNYEPLERRWNQCFRDFKEVGDGKAFFDVDEVFQMEPFMDEALEQKAAKGSDKWILGSGLLSFCSVTAIGFLNGNVAEQGSQVVIPVFGMAFAVLAFSFLLSVLYLVQEKRSSLSAVQSYMTMLTRLKECLPPTGRNNLIQTMFLVQAEQSRNLQEQTAQMRQSMEEYATRTLSEQIGNRFDEAIHLYLAPPIQKMADTQDVLLHRLIVDQHKRLDQLFTLFTTQVSSLLSEQLKGMAGNVSDASKGMQDITTALNTVSGAISVTLDQNRETTSQNSALLKELSATHGRLVERFSEATILLDDILISSKILADTTTNANLSTIELSEMAVRLHRESGEKFDLLNKETGEKYNQLTQVTGEKLDLLNKETGEKYNRLTQVTGEKFDLLRTTLDERLAASTTAAVALQDSLAAHAEAVRSGLGEYSTTVRESMREQAEQAALQQREQAEQAALQQREQAEQATKQQREQAEQIAQQQRVLAEQISQQQKEFAVQLALRHKDMTEQLNLQQREGTAQLVLQQRESTEQLVLEQRGNAEQLSLQQRELTDKLFGTLFTDAKEMEEHTISTLKQAQAWSLDVSRDYAQSANTLFDKIKIQNQELSQEIQAQGRSNTNMLITTNKILVETSAMQNKLLEEHSTQLLDAMKTDAERLVRSLHQEGAGLLQVLPTQMKEAFDSFTASMGETMRSTLTDSVDIIDKLGQKTEQLHSEFAMYFSRTEGNTNKLVDDLRFAMEGAIGKFSEMSNDSLNQLRDGNMEAMTAFAEQTRLLMEAVDEQTRTISLYIKDMGIDMGDLNKGLKSSVSEFSNQLQMGVEYTFKEFDTGLAEIVQRMTELGTSIEEAVQALPETIGRLNQGKD